MDVERTYPFRCLLNTLLNQPPSSNLEGFSTIKVFVEFGLALLFTTNPNKQTALKRAALFAYRVPRQSSTSSQTLRASIRIK